MRRCTLLLLMLTCLSSSAAAEEEITLRILPGRTWAVRPHQGPYAGIGSAFRVLGDWVASQGLEVDGHAAAAFFDDSKALPPEKLRSEALLPIVVPEGGAPLPSDECRLRTDPSRLVLRTIHHGSFESLGTTFDRLFRALPNRGIRYEGPSRQVYLTDPVTTHPTRVRIDAQIVVVPTGRSDVAVYADPGTWPVDLLAISDALDGAGIRFRPVTAADIFDGKLAKRADCLLVPGGWAASYRDALGKVGAKRIRDFVGAGGGYAGICAGAFYSATLIRWEGEEIPYDLDLFPGVPEGSLKEIAPWPGFALTDLHLRTNHPITRGLAPARKALYFGGPVLVPKEGSRVKILATYGEEGGPAMVAFRHRKGRVFLTGVHPEIQLGPSREQISWPEAEVEEPDGEPDEVILVRAVRWLLGMKPDGGR